MRSNEFIIENIAPDRFNLLKQIVHKHQLDYYIRDNWYAHMGYGDLVNLLQSYGGVPEFDEFYDDLNKSITPTIDRWTGGNLADDGYEIENFYTDLVNNGFFTQ